MRNASSSDVCNRSNNCKAENFGADPLKKREEFAISLRKKKKEEILREKRRRIHVPLDALPAIEPAFAS